MTLESDKAEEVVAALKAGGHTVRKIDDRWGGIPDYLLWIHLGLPRWPDVDKSDGGGIWADTRVAPQRTLFFETKVVDHEPPWTVPQLKLRPTQASFFRTWQGPAFVVAWQQRKGNQDGCWWVGFHPFKQYWAKVETPEQVAELLLGLRSFGPKRNAAWLTTRWT